MSTEAPGFFQFVAGSRFRCTPRWQAQPGQADAAVRIYLPTAGQAWISHHGRRHRLPPGGCLVFHGRLGVGRHCPHSCTLHYLHVLVPDAGLDRLLQDLPPQSIPVDGLEAALTTIRQVAEELPARGAWSWRQRCQAGAAVQAVLARALPEHDPPPRDPVVDGVRDWIDLHATERPDLHAMARIAGWVPNYFHRRFHALVGSTPQRYAEDVRLLRARSLLRDPDLSIAAVAARCGYDDPLYFSRVFRRRLGCSPSGWRTAAQP